MWTGWAQSWRRCGRCDKCARRCCRSGSSAAQNSTEVRRVEYRVAWDATYQHDTLFFTDRPTDRPLASVLAHSQRNSIGSAWAGPVRRHALYSAFHARQALTLLDFARLRPDNKPVLSTKKTGLLFFWLARSRYPGASGRCVGSSAGAGAGEPARQDPVGSSLRRVLYTTVSPGLWSVTNPELPSDDATH